MLATIQYTPELLFEFYDFICRSNSAFYGNRRRFLLITIIKDKRRIWIISATNHLLERAG